MTSPTVRAAGHVGLEVVRWILSLAILLAVWRWFLVPRLSATFLAPPRAVWDELWSIAGDGTMWSVVKTTMSEALTGFIIGAAIGLFLALCIGLMPTLIGKVIEPVVTAVYASPKFVIAPILFIWFGSGFSPRVILVATDVFPILTIYALGGIRTVNTDVVLMARLYGATSSQVATKVLVPHFSADVITGLTLALPRAITIAIGVEILFGTTDGIGGLLNNDTNLFDAAGVGATLVVGTVLCAVCIALTQGLGRLIRRRIYGFQG